MPLSDTHAEVMVVLPPKDRATPDRVFVYQNTPPEPAEADVSAGVWSAACTLLLGLLQQAGHHALSEERGASEWPS